MPIEIKAENWSCTKNHIIDEQAVETVSIESEHDSKESIEVVQDPI